jgi:ATP/maltotriose-dependent transcriptional regulator MalT
VGGRQQRLRQSERLLREAIGVLKRLEDRGTLCESQRALSEVLVRKGSIDEAERLALEALETVGEHDLSSRATTSMTMALVRAAQGRDDEAETLLDESLAMIEPTDFRGLEAWIISRAEFLRERPRRRGGRLCAATGRARRRPASPRLRRQDRHRIARDDSSWAIRSRLRGLLQRGRQRLGA